MLIQNFSLLDIISFAILISVSTGYYLMLRYHTKLARWAGLLLFSQAFELVCYLLQWVNDAPSAVQFLNLIQVLGYTFFCFFWLLFVFTFTRHVHWIRPRNLAFIITLPMIYLPMMAVRWMQGPLENPPGTALVGSIMVSPFTSGVIGILLFAYGYGVALFSILVLFQFYFRSSLSIRLLILPLLSGPFLLILVGLLEMAGINPFRPISIHQVSLASISLISLWAVIDLRFRTVLFSARETVVDQIQDGVLILDLQDRIVDLNSAAQQIIGSNRKDAVKHKLLQIWPQGSALAAGQPGTGSTVGESTIQMNGLECTFDTSVSQLLDTYREPVGRVIVLRNVTGRERMEKALNEHARELQRTNDFLAALAKVNANLQPATNSSQINAILGAELKKMGLVCFIAQLDPETNELAMNYLSAVPELITRIEKIIRGQVIGYRLDKKQFSPLYKILELKEIYFNQFKPGDLGSAPGMIPADILGVVIRLLGLQPDMAVLVLPLVTGDYSLGVMGVWGGSLSEADIPPFRLFANQVANVMERADLYEKEIRRSSELARSNNLVVALSKVASVLGNTSNSELALDTLGEELKKADLTCAVVSIDPAGEMAFIKYLSFSPGIIQKIEKITGIHAKDYPIPRRYWPGDRIITQQLPVWFPKPIDFFRGLFPNLSQTAGKQAFKLLNIEKNGQLCILPLISEGRTIGAMPIWGPNLRPDDSPFLSVFGSQVAGIIQNLTNYEKEVQRTTELARSNAMIMALSNVAARLDTTTNLPQVFDTMGSELKNVRVNSMVGTLDDAKQTMKVEYISVLNDLVGWAEKLGVFWPKEITIPRRLWPTDKAVTEKTPYWDPDLVGSSCKMFPFVPREIFIKVFELAGMNPKDQVCYLPMLSEEDVIGILAVWGPDIRKEDVPGLSVFANQVTTAIRNTRLYNQAQKEIVERTQAEVRIQEALDEKEVLLKEVHHRVKNNLQVITSLLNLQAGQTSDPITVNILRESQSRVRSMALIHEKLYQSNDLAHVDFAGYLHNLVNSLAQTYRANSEKVAIRVHSEKIALNIDLAVPCGLIINELVSNSLKYAFPDGLSGSIEVSCQRSQDGRCTLVVCDDGVGLPAGFDVYRGPSLGLRLVTSLVRQIDGELVVDSTKGSRFEVNFDES